jgi:hypothetical protein
MAERVSFSGQELGLDQIAKHHIATEAALREFFSPTSPSFLSRYVAPKPSEVAIDLAFSVAELEYNSAFTVMAAIEAALRTDYLTRAYKKKKDTLSRAFRAIHKSHGPRASLENEILVAWHDHGPMPASLKSALVSALNYRHWLAHGRYWEPKLGRKYDYFTVFGIAEELFELMDT